jgi:uncharacterized protein with ATP-grasp and redox domains
MSTNSSSLTPLDIDFDTSGDHVLIAAVENKTARIKQVMLQFKGAVSITFTSNSVDVGATYDFQTDDFLILDENEKAWFSGALGQDLTLNLSDDIQVKGSIYYVQD